MNVLVACILGDVRVFLCRHAEAEPGRLDAVRLLTADGRGQAHELAKVLAASDCPPQIVLSSPLARARATAEAIGEVTGARVAVDERLAPGARSRQLIAAVADTGLESVATVGHQPDCSRIALALTGADPGFPPAGMLPLELERGSLRGRPN